MPINSFSAYPLTWKPMLNKTAEPLYISLSNRLEEDIAKGVLRPGTKLPPQRELADFLDINVSTVSRAFKICANKGMIRGAVGSGTYVAYDVQTNIFSPPCHKSSLIALGSLVPEAIPQVEAMELLQKMMVEPGFEELFQYAHGEQCWHKEAALQLLARGGCPACAENVLLASGAQNALAAILAGLFQPGDKIGTDPLVYPGLKSAAKLFGIQLVPMIHENHELSRKGIEYAVKNDAIKAIYVMPDAQNPTTHTMSFGCRSMIAETAKELNLTIIEDSVNSCLYKNPMEAIAVKAPNHTIYIASLTKMVIPALRLAYIVSPKQFYPALDNALYNINISQSALLIELTSRLILSGGIDTLLDTRRRGMKMRNQLTDQILQGYEIWGNEESLSRWLILPKGVSGAQFEQWALQKGVLVYGSQRFAVGKNTPVGAVRLAVCAPKSLEELERGLIIVRELLQAL